MLFNTRSNAISTFDLRIKPFLNASNTDFSVIFHILCYQRTECYTGSGASEEKSHICICLSAGFHEHTRQEAYRDYVPVYRDVSGHGNYVLHSLNQIPYYVFSWYILNIR